MDITRKEELKEGSNERGEKNRYRVIIQPRKQNFSNPGLKA